MILKISPKLSEARDLPQTYRQTVPQTRPCNSKASITRSVVRSKADKEPARYQKRKSKEKTKTTRGYSEETVQVIISGGSPEGRSETTMGRICETGRF